MPNPRRAPLASTAAIAALLALAGCTGGGHYYGPAGDGSTASFDGAARDLAGTHPDLAGHGGVDFGGGGFDLARPDDLSQGGGCGACGFTCCGAQCVDTSSDADHCGGCNVTCATGQGESCINGGCGCGVAGNHCQGGTTCCNTTGCVALATDPSNCGSCGHACPQGSTCTNGVCGTLPGTCTTSADCPMGQSCFLNMCF